MSSRSRVWRTYHDEMHLRQIGIGHPAVKDVLNVANNTTEPLQSRGGGRAVGIELALLLGVRIDSVYYPPDLVRSPHAEKKATEATERVYRAYEVSAKTMHRISERDRPEGLLALVEMPRWRPEDIALGDDALIIVADGLEIPGNLGTLLRTADGAGAEYWRLRTGAPHEPPEGLPRLQGHEFACAARGV